MKLKYNFETMEMDGEICAVPVGANSDEFHGIIHLNDVGEKMLNYISECENPEEVLEKLIKDFPEDNKNDIANKLCDFLNQLVKEGLLIP